MEMRVPRGTATGSLIHGFGEMPRCFLLVDKVPCVSDIRAYRKREVRFGHA